MKSPCPFYSRPYVLRLMSRANLEGFMNAEGGASNFKELLHWYRGSVKYATRILDDADEEFNAKYGE